ncbi:hypothetical protein EOM81_01675 [bacterium]|nr:hypothetical protein [bacterium]
MSNKKEIVRSAEAEAIVNTLKESGKSMTLAEISAATGLDLKTGHLSSGRSAGLIEADGEKEIEVLVKKSVKTYKYIGD